MAESLPLTPELFDEMCSEHNRAIRKHHGYTPSDPNMSKYERLVILTEEIGEVARAMTYDNGDRAQLRQELIQVAAMALASVAGMDGE